MGRGHRPKWTVFLWEIVQNIGTKGICLYSHKVVY